MTALPDHNREAFRQAAEVLRMQTFDVVNPHELDHAEPGMPHEFYMQRDLAILLDGSVSAVVVLPGWENSKGAVAEVVCSQAVGIEVWTYQPFCEDLEVSVVAETIRTLADTPVRAGHPRYYELLDRMADVHSSKSLDYADGAHTGDPLRNLRGAGEMGIAPWKGVLVRISDKFNRLLTFARRESFEVKDESVADTLVDLANYALLALVLYEEPSDGTS